MKENKYDDLNFFNQYAKMPRSEGGLPHAGEWPALRRILPDFQGKRVLDLGCGYGWHCQYAVEQGAMSVVGIDISGRMLEVAGTKHSSPVIEYRQMAIEDFDYPPESFDIVLSSLAFHYVEAFGDICSKVHRSLVAGGTFVFSVEHPIFTAQGRQEWYCDGQGKRLHWPVDAYFEEGVRKSVFLNEEVTKYHRTLTTYVGSLLKTGFALSELIEPEPGADFLDTYPESRDELRRPLFLILSAVRR